MDIVVTFAINCLIVIKTEKLAQIYMAISVEKWMNFQSESTSNLAQTHFENTTSHIVHSPHHKHPQPFPEACLYRTPKNSGGRKNAPNGSQMSECVA